MLQLPLQFILGSMDGIVVRDLASNQCGLGLILAWCH